jgi:hypothetical protein
LAFELLKERVSERCRATGVEFGGFFARTNMYLQLPYQLAIAHYMAVDGEAWDNFMAIPWPPSKDGIKAALVTALPRYVAEYGDCRYGVLSLDTQVLKDAIMQDRDITQDFLDWDGYHTWYLRNAETPVHPDTDLWPAILSNFAD